ncbi:MAG: Gfo/Idh/MocA family oxidoreductase [Bacteroidales bacterium]|nr:Gfo/Idh/MocA family oxidoreductase [Bacteroidales bacterium]
MKRILAIAIVLLALSACSSNKVIRTKVPARPAGQEDVIGLRLPPMDTIRMGFIGLGMRGFHAVKLYSNFPNVKIVALADIEPDRVEKSQARLERYSRPRAAGYSGAEDSWKGLCERDDINLVYICTDWKNHAPMALYAMEHGKNVAIEVPAATTMKEIWDLINMAESKRLHCMMLENCVYDFFELTTLNMAQQGLFGEVVHCEGSYNHCLDGFWHEYWQNWRLEFNASHKGDIYPTHGLGPVCQVMNIHRGDRMKTLSAMETRSVVGKRLWKEAGRNPEEFQNGDVTMTMISTENGNSILIEHDVMTPRPYNRMYQVVGTEGYAAKYPVEQFSLRPDRQEGAPDLENLNSHKPVTDEVRAALMEKYRSPILTKELEETAKKVGGHGGMDFVMDYRLVYCLTNGLPLDMDVYDLAEWCCLSELGAISIAHGGAPVEVPDFTRGAWNKVKGYSYAFAE